MPAGVRTVHACLFFGCRDDAGHFLWLPGSPRMRSHDRELTHPYGGDHIDGTLAPIQVNGTVTYKMREANRYRGEELPPGRYLVHHLPNGYTAMAWWDRSQGDTRSGSNSVLLLKGERTAVEMQDALATHFPEVLLNLVRSGVLLERAE